MDESDGAIYVPPKDGLPFLVVTFSGGDFTAQPTSTRAEARVILAKRTRRKRVPVRNAGEALRVTNQH